MDRPHRQLNFNELIERLPAFQKVMERCMVTMSKPYASAREISTWIESDSALSGRVLGLANSSYYGQMDKVLRTERAVVLLGRRALEDVFYSFYIQGLFSAQGGSEVSRLWKESLRSGICAKELTLATGLPSSEGEDTPDAGAYLTGLLHDAGKLLVLTHYPDAYEAARSAAALSGHDECEAQRRTWGFDHARLAEAMARKWSLPRTVCEAIGRHHDPPPEAPDLLDSVVRCADILCAAQGAGIPAGEAIAAAPEAMRQALRLERLAPEALDRMMETVEERMRAFDTMMDGGPWQMA